MGQSKSCFAKDQTVKSISLLIPDDIHTSDQTSKVTLSSRVLHPTTRAKLLSSAAVTGLRGPIDSESRFSHRGSQCTESKNLHSNARLTNLKLPASATDDAHALIKNPQGMNKHRLAQDLNSTVNTSPHSKIHLIEKKDQSIYKDENDDSKLLPSNTSDTEITTSSATTAISDILVDTNVIDIDVPGDSKVPRHIKCNNNNTEDTNNDTINDDINDSIVVRKRATIRESLKHYLKMKLGSHSPRLEGEPNLLGNDTKTMLIQPHPIALNLDSNNKMKFFHEKRSKLSRLTKGKGKRKENEYFIKPPKNKTAAIMGIRLPKVRKTKIKIVVRNQAEVKKCIQERTDRSRRKVDYDDVCQVVCGRQIYATRYYEENDYPNITTVKNAETIDANLDQKDLTQDGSINNYNLKENLIDDGAGEQIISKCEKVSNNSIATCQSQTCIRVSDGEKPELNNTLGLLRVGTANTRACGTMNSKSPTAHIDRSDQRVDDYGQWYLNNYSTFAKQISDGAQDVECKTGKRLISVAIPRGISHYLYVDYALQNTRVEPVNEMACVDHESKIYICDIGLTSSQCDFIANVAEHCSSGAYASYTYAKQTLGCREHDEMAAVCEWPVMRACSTIQTYLEAGNDKEGVYEKSSLVLDEREPHVVKYDISRVEHQKLDMHTDKSEWTFLISLSDGDGCDYEGGGTFFESIDSTVHLQKGHALFFPGKLRHRGQKIISGTRYLLVGFLVEKTFEIPYLFD